MCELTPKEIEKTGKAVKVFFLKAATANKKNAYTPSDFWKELCSFVETKILPKSYDLSGKNATLLAQEITGALTALKLNNFTSCNAEDIASLITSISTGNTIENPKLNDASDDNIVNTLLARIRKEATIKFLDDAFGVIDPARKYYVRKHRQSLFDALFINRGSVNSEKGVVTSESKMNDNIRAYKELLFNLIKEFLISRATDPAEKQKYREMSLFKKEADKDGIPRIVYTQALEQLSAELDKYIGANKFASTMRRRFSKINTDANEKIALDAYVAYMWLKNFDSYLAYELGDSMLYNNFNIITGEDDYHFGKNASSLLTTWRDNDDINPEDEADVITKFAVTTTPLHAWQNSSPIQGLYLNYSDFDYICAKIKNLLLNPRIDDIVFDQDFIDDLGTSEIWDSFSKETLDIIKNHSLGDIIGSIRHNPKRFINPIFEILTNLDFYNTFGNYFNFSDDEKNKLYSLSLHIFNPNNSDSLYSLSQTNSEFDYYGYITEAVDSTFANPFVLYSRDLESKSITLRSLFDATIYNIGKRFEERIIMVNGSRNNLRMDEWIESMKFEALDKNNKETNDAGDAKTTRFVIPGTDIVALVNLQSASVNFYKNGALILNLGNDTWEEVKEFIDNTLSLGMEDDPLLEDGIKNAIPDYTHDLLVMASRIVSTKFAGYKFINDVDYANKNAAITNLFGSKGPKFNWRYNEMGLIHPKDVPLKEKISEVLANISGEITSSIIRDGKGNAQSKNTLSRLMGSYLQQWRLLNKSEKSASRDSILFKCKGLFEGVFTAKEYSDLDSTKEVNSFTVKEMSTSGFLYDFIGGFIERDAYSRSIVGNGHVLFIPSVNSDKSTISRIKIDLNSQYTFKDGSVKTFKEMSVPELQLVISDEFGTFYTNIFDKVTSDFKKIDLIISKTIGNNLNLLNQQRILQGLEPIILDMPRLEDDCIYKFENFNETFKQLYQLGLVSKELNTPSKFLKNIVREYNQANPLNIIELIDLIHFIDKGNLSFNESFLELICRFNPDKAEELGLRADFTQEQFWELKERNLLNSLIKSKFSINLSDNSAESNYLLKNIDRSWINISENMVLAKLTVSVNGVDQVVKVSSKMDLLKRWPLKDADGNNVEDADGNQVYYHLSDFVLNPDASFTNIINSPNIHVEINPYLLKYNTMDYLFTLAFMNSTVGSFIAHPVKDKFINVLEEEAARFNAQHKRNVLFTAAMHEFLLNTLNGIPDEYNIAVIEDVVDWQHTIGGQNNKIKPFDGATFVNPFVVYLENYALGGAKAGITKKLFVHYYNPETGNSGIIKTCGFGLTNDWMRNSEFLLRMMKKMTDHIWRDLQGNPFVTNINQDFRGPDFKLIEYKPIYFEKDGRFYKVESIESLGDNKYIRKYVEVSESGTVIGNLQLDVEPQIANTNYTLWLLFGGLNSMAINEKTKKLEYSNTSVLNVVTAMNHIGIPINSEFRTLADVYQPLKHSDIHYCPTIGAVKLGSANVNSADRYFDEVSYDYLKIKMYQSGILLDKEHHADNAELSLMTLVISACAAKGYTFEAATRIYDALASATELGLSDEFDALLNPTDDSSLLEVVNKIIIDNLANSKQSNKNFAEIIARDIMRRAKNKEDIKFADLPIPLSDITIFNKICSIITTYITLSGIKLKIPGILSVLTPSYGIMKIHGGKKLEAVKDMEELQRKTIPHYSSDFKLDLNSSNFMGYTLQSTTITGEREVIIDGKTIILLDTIVPPVRIVGDTLEYDIDRLLSQYKLQSLNFKSPQEYFNYLFLKAVLSEKYDLKGAELESEIQRCLSNDITDVDIDRTYFIETSTDNVLTDQLGLVLTVSLDGVDYYIANDVTKYKNAILDLRIPENLQLDPNEFNVVINPDNSISVKSINTDYMVPVVSSMYVLTPSEYRKLKSMYNRGLIKSITEDVKTGRELASYNVRFKDSNGNKYLIWDLDSANNAYILNDIKESDSDLVAKVVLLNDYFRKNGLLLLDIMTATESDFLEALEEEQLRVNRLLLLDLINLSPTRQNTIELFNSFVTKIDSLKPLLKIQAITNWANIKFATGNGNSYIINGELVDMDIHPERFPELMLLIQLDIENSMKVSINKTLVDIDASSIRQSAYEVIMPKTFASCFGLDTFADLNKISKNKDYFLEKFIENYRAIIKDSSLFDIELKNTNGKHLYLLSKNRVAGKGLKKLTSISTAVVDGKTLRLYPNGDIMYEMLDGDEIWVDDKGNEIIVSENIGYYVDNLHYDDIRISDSIDKSEKDRCLEIFDYIKNSSNIKALRSWKHLTSKVKGNKDSNVPFNIRKKHPEFDIETILETNKINPTKQNKYLYKHIVKTCLEKHTSFLKSLDVVAARIPAQSMQSFMPMKIVAFDNPDINTAHVSTMQILLLGSDY